MKISVAMITFNGENYVREQIDSILKQLNAEDEIVISDDGSSDKTLEYIKGFSDERIKVYRGPRQGISKNVENALLHCENEIIFLADQDDVWKDNKVEEIKNIFNVQTSVTCVLHNKYIGTKDLDNVIENLYPLSNKLVSNILKNTYQGCCMAVKRNILQYVLPIPSEIPMYDQWIGCINNIYGRVYLCDQRLIVYRRHENNVTGHRTSFTQKIRFRYQLVKCLWKRITVIRQRGQEDV